MKNVWLSFCCATFFMICFIAFFRSNNLSAQERGPAAAGGLKSDVPLSREMELALERKKSNIENQERELKLQEQRLQEESVVLSQKIKDLEGLLKQKEKFEADRARLASEDFSKLVKTYEKMPAKNAAAVIAAMEDKLALDVLQSLKEKPLAAVLSAMPAERATDLTSKLLKRVPASPAKALDQSRD